MFPPCMLVLFHLVFFLLCFPLGELPLPDKVQDGSKLPLEENIALTRSVVELCETAGVPVEGELGRVGGKEDDLVCENAGYTDPDEAVL